MPTANGPFPYEILSIIVSDLSDSTATIKLTNDKDDYETRRPPQALNACHSVSVAFRRLSLPYLYRRIRISNTGKFRHPENCAKHVARLREIIDFPWAEQADGVARHIKSMSLWFKGQYPDHELQLSGFFADENLLHIMQELSGDLYGISQLAINLSMNTFGVTNWPDLPAEFRSAFHKLILSPHLDSLYVQDIHNIPIQFLRGTHFKRLNMDRNIFFRHFLRTPLANVVSDSTENNLNFLPNFLPYPPLEDLVTTYSFPFDNSCESPLRNLRRLVVYDESHCVNTRNLMNISQNTLEDVQIYITAPESEIIPQSLLLNKMVMLKTLFYLFDYGDYDPVWVDHLDPLSSLSRMFYMTSPVPQLETIEIELCCSIQNFGDYNEDFLGPLIVLYFGDTLLDQLWSSPIYPALRRVMIGFRVRIHKLTNLSRPESEFTRILTAEILKEKFPGLGSSTNIVFETKVNIVHALN